jgi:predicted nucleic acid-binding protein
MPVDSEPIAVNTGPLIALSACRCLEVLKQLHAQVVVPQAVLEEFVRGRSAETR